MPIELDDVRLPLNVEEGAQWRMATMTDRNPGFGANEVRYAKRRVLWRASLTILPEDAGEMIGMIYRQTGPRYAFRARCNAHYSTWDVPNLDLELTMRELDGKWPLTIGYGDSNRKAVRRIVAPVIDDDFKIFKDDVEVDPALYTIQEGGLVVPIPSPPQNWDDAVITWQGYFDTPVNIDADENVVPVLANGIRTVILSLTETPFDLSDV